VDDILFGSTFWDPHDQCRYFEHHFQLAIAFKYLQRGVHMSTWTWGLGLQWSFEYFNMVASTSTWDPGSPTYFNIMVHNYPWDLGIWLYFLITSIEEKSFLKGMECSVYRGIIWVPRKVPKGNTSRDVIKPLLVNKA
jgi:hypothetical protein